MLEYLQSKLPYFSNKLQEGADEEFIHEAERIAERARLREIGVNPGVGHPIPLPPERRESIVDLLLD